MPTPSGAGHPFQFVHFRFLSLYRNIAPIGQIMAQPIGRWFFPGREWAGAVRCEAPIAHPLYTGKNSGGRKGFKGSVALSLLRPVTYRVIRRFANASAKSKAVLFSAVFRPGGRLCPPPRLVSRHHHAKSCRCNRQHTA